MITYLQGTLAAKQEQSPRGPLLVVDIQGLGYEILTNGRSVAEAPSVGEAIRVHTSLVVREDALFLVGFLTREERDLFSILQGASGVGIKVALSLLSDLSVPEIVQAVVSEDYRLLTAAKGVGPKLAQKIILELKEKMLAWRESAPATGRRIDPAEDALLRGPLPQAFVEAETVLLSLGYTPEEVFRSLKAIRQETPDPARLNAETLLRESLRWLARV